MKGGYEYPLPSIRRKRPHWAATWGSRLSLKRSSTLDCASATRALSRPVFERNTAAAMAATSTNAPRRIGRARIRYGMGSDLFGDFFRVAELPVKRRGADPQHLRRLPLVAAALLDDLQ